MQTTKIFLVHGHGGNSSHWQGVINQLPPTLDVITYELPGHGTRAKALRDLIFRFSHLVVELGDSVAEFGMNPVIVNHAGCTIVDALVIPR